MEVYFTITNSCNLECAHCYASSGPGKESMKLKDIKKVVNNLPKKLHYLWITGGEVFTRKRLLYDALETISQSEIDIKHFVVQTNGYWAKDKDTARKTLEELAEFGVTGVDAASNDEYHQRAGLDLSRPRILIKESLEMDMNYGRDYRRCLGVLPRGRALDLSKKYWARIRQCESECRKGGPAINYKGKVYPCQLIIPGMEIGDARKEKLTTIMQRAKKDKNLSTLLEPNGHYKLARKAGLTHKEIKATPEYKHSGRCGLCTYLFREGLVKLGLW